MTEEDQILWSKIKKYSIDNSESEFTFTDRLARENSWTMEYALRVVYEYKRFIFLICIAKHPLTPSDQVDQVWHLHLIYTESYWVDFCKNTLNRNIQHGPTKGGGEEKDKFANWYEKTKDLYCEVFEGKPPQDIWPQSTIRFGEINFSRVNLHKNWIIRKPRLFKKWKF